jgi:transcriptional regulator
MYIPRHFEVTDDDEIFAFIEANAFGQIISSLQGKLFSTHIPFLLSSDKQKLVGHLAKQNPQHSDMDKQEVLVTLQGPHAYISPSWYKSPGVPTWNYQAVHIYGVCEVFDDHEIIKTIVDTLTRKYESSFQNPWQPDYKTPMLGAIVGIEVTIKEIQCKYKLSQNRPAEDREQVIERLEITGSIRLAKTMRRIVG